MAFAKIETLEMEHNNCLPEIRRPLWSDKETKYFIKILAEYQITQHLEHRKYRNAGVFQALEGPMRAAGFNRTYNQLRIKWKNMKKSFVDGRRLVSAGSSPYSVCPFYDDLHQLLKDHPMMSQNISPGEEPTPNFDTIDIASNASDCRDDFEENQEESALELFNHFAESSSVVAIKKEHSSSEEQLCIGQSQPTTYQKLSCPQDTDPDQLFLAMILPDIKKLSAPKKRRVKMDIQKLLDEALTEEDQ